MATKTENYNSPMNYKTPALFKKSSLIKLIDTWNSCKKNKIIYKKSYNSKKLSELLNEHMKNICDDKQYWCWPGVIRKIAKDPKMTENIKLIEKTELRPEMPSEWYKNPIEWLSNYDIEDVMIQYNNDKKYKYAFLGVFPIDFAVQDKFGRCLYSHICSINVKKYIKKGIKYIGFITNLDKHNESGSHWTSTFIIIDPLNKSYGAHYYDSNANVTPKYVKMFLNTIKKQLDIIYPLKKFTISHNIKRHQMKNTECGMFSMAYQIRWLNAILKYKKLKLSSPYENANFRTHIINDKNITDNKMEESRKYLYRPNLEHHLSSRNINLNNIINI